MDAAPLYIVGPPGIADFVGNAIKLSQVGLSGGGRSAPPPLYSSFSHPVSLLAFVLLGNEMKFTQELY